MFLNEKTVLRSGLFEGIKLASYQQGDTLALCRFGPARTISMVAIGQNLDKLLVFDLTSLSIRLLSDKSGSIQEQPFSEQNQQQLVSYISIKDHVIETVAVVQGASDPRAKSDSDTNKDLLLIGCSNSIMIYDTFDQQHLFSVQTSSKITMIASNAVALTTTTTNFDLPDRSSRLLFCGGVQKLYAYHLDCGTQRLNSSNTLTQDAGDDLINFELSYERTISETVSCLIRGLLGPFECLVAGFHERRIKVFTIDLFDQSIQMCRLTLTETSKINCLCAIGTVVHNSDGQTGANEAPGAQALDLPLMSDLPSIIDSSMNQDLPGDEARDRPQMKYFAYGLENGTVGVYRLLVVTSGEANESLATASLERDSSEQHKKEQVSIFGERLWRHRSKQAVVALSLFDIDGDGQDELIVGYRNGRLEVRSSFTGQLITKSRCFKTSGQQLVGFLKWSLSEGVVTDTTQSMAPIDTEANGKAALRAGSKRDILLACSSTSSLVVFKPKQRRPHQVLVDHLSGGQRLSHQSNRAIISLTNYESSLGQQQLGLDWPSAQGRHLVLVDQDSDHAAENDDDDDDDDPTATQGANKLPLSCESKQNPELLQQIGLMKRRHEKLGQRFNQIQRELLRKQLASNQAALDLISGCIKSDQIATTRLKHCWNFDATNNKLLLTLFLEPVVQDFQVAIELIEIQDKVQRLLPTGLLIVHPVKVSDGALRKSILLAEPAAEDSKSSQETNEPMSHPRSVSVDLVLGSYAIAQYRRWNCADSQSSDSSESKLVTDHEPVELKLSIYLANGADGNQIARPQKRLLRHGSTSFVVQNVLERTISMPRFAMFVPESLVGTSDVCVQPSRPMIRKTFVLPERANKLRVLDWLNSHFLCFQFDQLIDHENYLPEFHGNEEDIWMATARDHQFEPMRTHTNILLDTRKLSGTSSSQASGSKELEDPSEEVDNDIGFKYEFLDLETLEANSNKSTAVANARRLRLKFSPDDRRLVLASDDSDLLVELIQMLIIEQLQLSVNQHSINETTSTESDGVGELLKELQTINENSRQLEESERRIQTEIYESAELVKSLIQQLNIANELKEYGISRELVAEISMILNGTQNLAQAFNLNNRTRLNQMKQANCLREKVLFLTGNEKGERVS